MHAIAVFTLEIAGTALGVAITVHLEIGSENISCSLLYTIAVTTIYYCCEPSSSLKESKADQLVKERVAVQQ
ncbi:hypothetical protein GO684_01665 [Wolbachia endosymbiont of Litomosoides brasiliensis]|uniref:TomO hydrophobic C-terminal domain-containing protein n=1 Tax=Wolbachia endosymbiont of Litomosoides brasiliensis TaxID=1812117 RepID=UPI00158F417F|nr:hypothetical protein [Wolbachia endosymbiont of Litomosoides brasiliensis]NUY39409.1 hypothetical protein [Wolbachia endosymbiont of Litomosoides brasiliensis]